MFLISANVGPFKSIDTPQDVKIEETITPLVGMNEAGKTVFLQALEKAHDALGVAKFDPIEDYPRKDLSQYLKQHKTSPSDVVVLSYRLAKPEIDELNAEFGLSLKADFAFSLTFKYDNSRTVSVNLDDKGLRARRPGCRGAARFRRRRGRPSSACRCNSRSRSSVRRAACLSRPESRR
jgi:hypothetical protein